MKKLIMICAVVGLMSAGISQAAVTLNFGELPIQPVDGLSYMGVTFGFTLGGSPSTEAYYNSLGPEPGTTVFVQSPVLEGFAAGVLTLDFAPLPTDQLQFGVALNNIVALTPGFTVELFDTGMASLGVTAVDTSPLALYTEGYFAYGGAVPISRAVIDFDENWAGAFALDNLTFNVVEAANHVIPTPGALVLGSMGVAVVSWLRRRRTL